MLSPSQGLGRRSPRLGVKVRASLCLCRANTRECGFSMSPSCFFSGLQFPRLSSMAEHHLTLPFSRGAHGAPLAVPSLPVFSLSCLSLLPSAVPSQSQRQREGTCCPCSGTGAEYSQLITDVVACRWGVKSHRALPGCTWRHCPPPAWSALLSLDRQTVPATFLHRLQPLLQDSSQICGAREVPGAQRQSQGGNLSSFWGTWGPREVQSLSQSHRAN